MNPASYYHSPPKPVSTRALCPVCRQAVYSLAGIHPQCAERQSDPPRPKSKSNADPLPVSPPTQGSVAVATIQTPAAPTPPASAGRAKKSLTAK
jgi:hypothetical protein